MAGRFERDVKPKITGAGGCHQEPRHGQRHPADRMKRAQNLRDQGGGSPEQHEESEEPVAARSPSYRESDYNTRQERSMKRIALILAATSIVFGQDAPRKMKNLTYGDGRAHDHRDGLAGTKAALDRGGFVETSAADREGHRSRERGHLRGRVADPTSWGRSRRPPGKSSTRPGRRITCWPTRRTHTGRSLPGRKSIPGSRTRRSTW